MNRSPIKSTYWSVILSVRRTEHCQNDQMASSPVSVRTYIQCYVNKWHVNITNWHKERSARHVRMEYNHPCLSCIIQYHIHLHHVFVIFTLFWSIKYRFRSTFNWLHCEIRYVFIQISIPVMSPLTFLH